MLLFWLLSIITITLSRFYLRRTLKYFREKGYNLRHVLIVGAGDLAKNLAEKINLHPEIGFNIVGFLTDHSDKVGQSVSGKKILGQLEEVQKIVREYKIDQLFIALPRHAHDRLEKVISYLGEEFVDIKVVPDLLQFMRINPGIEDMDGLPIVSLSEGPLYGWNKLFKRFADILASLIMLIVMSPAITIIAIAIKLTSKGPLLYNQERMGFSGRHFTMYKFRTMFEDAEKKTGAIWARKDDSRTTSIGKLLRKTSLDELPQFFNVLKGDMSIVGPRPERPVFVKDFKKSVYQYMLRHKMKAGITGWAQVNGWRGDSSLEKRIEYDLYYIENWSFLFDLKIIWLTFWKGLINKNAY
jgi:Undecaprenyl-phosphate glucose phosphotransferase